MNPEQPERGIRIIGHVDHDSLHIARAMTEILAAREEQTLTISENYRRAELVKLDVENVKTAIQTPYIKKHKPNKGITLGSYKKH